MKLLISLCLVAVLAIGGVFVFQFIHIPELNTLQGDVLSNKSDFTTFRDNDFGFEIQHPLDWKPDTNQLKDGPVVFRSADDNAHIIMKIIAREKHETLKQFGDRYFKKNDAFRISEYYRNANTTFAGLPSIKMIGMYTYNPNVFQQLKGYEGYVRKTLWDVALVENRDAFFGLVYFAKDQPNFNTYLPTVQRMIDSVKLTNRQPIFQEED